MSVNRRSYCIVHTLLERNIEVISSSKDPFSTSVLVSQRVYLYPSGAQATTTSKTWSPWGSAEGPVDD